MRKMKLTLDNLSVETFVTVVQPRQFGTIRGHDTLGAPEDTDALDCYEGGGSEIHSCESCTIVPSHCQRPSMMLTWCPVNHCTGSGDPLRGCVE